MLSFISLPQAIAIADIAKSSGSRLARGAAPFPITFTPDKKTLQVTRNYDSALQV
jgi:hypothetical protein